MFLNHFTNPYQQTLYPEGSPFFTPNGCTGARLKENLTHVNAVFADWDFKPKERTGDNKPDFKQFMLDLSDLPAPSIVVESGNGWHLYWLLDESIVVTEENRDLLTKQVEGIHRFIHERYGSDSGAMDVLRLMRLPGYEHKKMPQYPFMVQVIEENDDRYTLEELMTAMPPVYKEVVEVDDSGEDDFDIKQVVIDVWKEKGDVVSFDTLGKMIWNEQRTATFIGRKGKKNYIATTSDDFPYRGNATTYVAGVLGMSTKQAYKWLIKQYGEPRGKQNIESKKEVKFIPTREAYLKHLAEGEWDDEKWVKELKVKAQAYFVDFYLWVQQEYPYLKFEIGTDKSFWNYNDTEGIYEPLAYPTVIGIIIKELRKENMDMLTTESNARRILINFMADGKRGVTLNSFIHSDDMLHVKNGWLERKTLILHPHTPERLSLFKMAVDYDPNASCPLYDKFLDVDSQLGIDQVRVIDQYSGLVLTDNINEQKMLILEGRPGCAKSMIPEIWMEILGRKATTKSLVNLDSSKTRFIGDSLAHRTLCWFDEANPKTANVNEFFMGLITNKMLEIERKGLNNIEYVKNTLKLVMSLNEMPDHMPEGMKRRYRHILFTRSFTDDGTVDTTYQDKIRTNEISGVFNRMLKGLSDYQKMGRLTTIDGEEDRKDEYTLASDDISAFISEHFDPIHDNEIRYSFSKLRDAFSAEFPKTYNKGLSVQAFNKKLKSVRLPAFKHVKTGRNMSARGYVGMVLKSGHNFSKFRESSIEIAQEHDF